MRKASFALAAIAAIPVYASAGAGRANAETIYPYCTTPTWSEGLNCAYQTREQCSAVNAGMPTTCVANPSYTGAQAESPRPTSKRVR